jgi:hypothetical protein
VASLAVAVLLRRRWQQSAILSGEPPMSTMGRTRILLADG